ncbi:MAG TPA: hypothetical protein VN904_05165 [Chthoniobacterales bacterium]|jgi:hypothetical protein|nr:hypothetical protein [Chthoniobacterales bacterium]
MKILLAILLCPVFIVSQCFAIDGGPFGGGSGKVRVTGTYAGVFVPIPTVNPAPPPDTLTDNSLVLFTMKIPKDGLASGTVAVFRNGISYQGTIQGSGDPDSGRLTGIVTSSFLLKSSLSTSSTVFEYDGNGQFVNAKIVPNPNASSSATNRIKGKASLTYHTNAPADPNCFAIFPATCPRDPNGESPGPIKYRVRGFKQSEASS